MVYNNQAQASSSHERLFSGLKPAAVQAQALGGQEMSRSDMGFRGLAARIKAILHSASVREQQGILPVAFIEAEFRLEGDGYIQFQQASAYLHAAEGLSPRESIAAIFAIGLEEAEKRALHAAGCVPVEHSPVTTTTWTEVPNEELAVRQPNRLN